MDARELAQLKKTFSYAWQKTVPQLAHYKDSAVQDLIGEYVRLGKKTLSHKKACYMVIDYLRANFVGRRSHGTTDEMQAQKSALVFANSTGDNSEKYLIGHTNQLLLDETVHLRELLPHVDVAERPMFLLYYRWGFNLAEIGELFDRSDTWVYLKLKAVHQRLKALLEKTR